MPSPLWELPSNRDSGEAPGSQASQEARARQGTVEASSCVIVLFPPSEASILDTTIHSQQWQGTWTGTMYYG